MRNNILRNSLLSLLIFSGFAAYSQNVGINITGATPTASAILDLSTGTTHLGFLAPQASLISTVDVATILAPATGLIIYNTNAGMTNGEGKGYYYWNGAAWVPVSTVGNWLLTGNSGTTVGTNYLGTNDANALEFKVDGSLSGYLDYLGTAANSFYGYQAGINNAGGQYNTGVGYQALKTNTSGTSNTGVGYGASFTNSTGTYNTAVGYDALYHNTVSNNTAVGYYALVSNSTGINNTAIGYESDWLLVGNQNGNSSLGAYSLQNNISGWNTAIGYQAGYENTSGSYNTWLGLQSGANAGNYNNSTAIGALAYVAASNIMVLGSINGVNTSTNDINVGIGTTAPTQKLHVNNGNILLSNYAIGSDGATVGQLQLQGTGSGVTTLQAGAQGATNYNYTLPTTAPTVGQIVDVSAYAAPNVSLSYLNQPTGNIIGIIVVTSTTAATALAAGTTFILYRVIGGGAAGGGGDFTTVGGCISSTAGAGDMAGAGGGAGGYTEGIVTGLQGAASTYAVTIGAGGVGQTACNSITGDGGNTTLTIANPAAVIISPGGAAGPSLEEEQSANTFFKRAGGSGGLPANAGALNIQGANGGYASITQNGTDASESGPGGSSIFGGGASGYEERDASGQSGNPATNYGSGGGGGTYADCTVVNRTCTGGNGFQGIVIIYEYQ